AACRTARRSPTRTPATAARRRWSALPDPRCPGAAGRAPQRSSALGEPLGILPAPAGEPLVGGDVSLPCPGDDCRRQGRGRGCLAPTRCSDEVAHVLLVERGLARTGAVLCRVPESARVGGQHLVDKRQLAADPAELE